MTSNREDRKFGTDFLDSIVKGIVENIPIADVYPGKELEQWAREKGWGKADA